MTLFEPGTAEFRLANNGDREYSHEEIARHAINNPLRVYNVTIQQVEQLARAYLDELRDKAPFNFAGWGDWLHSDISNLLLREERKAISLETAQWRPDSADVWTGWSRVGARRSGRLLDGVEHTEYPKTL